MASSSSSSSANNRLLNKYDVFLSFRGADTRNSFISVLCGGFRREKINVFIDNELNRGDEISPSLLDAIKDSTISVVVISEGYSASRWCLEELVKIIEYKKMLSQIVLPVFFHVDPSHVRNQTGTFGYRFAMLVERFRREKLQKLQMTQEQFKDTVQKWRNALTEVANLAAYNLTPTMSEFGTSEKIVSDILETLNYLSSPIDNNNDLVGIQPIISYITKYLLRLNDRYDVHTIGIWGMGGMGKTTIAEVLFNAVRKNFEASYFASNVREKSSNHDTLAILRRELFSTIINDQHCNINFSFTKRRLGCKKVIIVFDDVTNLSQIQFLIGDLQSLGPGSRIIVTTRNKQVLRNFGVDEHNIYMIEGLSHFQALQLFRRYAFRPNHHKTDYDELSNQVVQYAKGVPLALKVLGSSLLEKSKEVWESAINKLEIIPHEDIQGVLKVSYDGLNDVEKNIFLDIACFLKWENRDFAIEFLDACGFYAKFGIDVLIDKCLVTISSDNKITMHDLLQEMGWEIVRQESTKDPGERSRLWHHEDIYSVLEENTGTKKIQGICLDTFKRSEIMDLQPCALQMMRKLRFFKLHNSNYKEDDINKVHVSQDLNCVFNELRYLCWHGFPLKSLQSNFRTKNLVAIDMRHSNMEELWIGAQLVKLKHINLSHSKHLRRILDLSFAPNLESLILEGCTSLLEICSSIPCLNKLVILNLKHCKSFHSLPTCLRLESLRVVILSYCSNLKTFCPEMSCNLEELYLDETAIDQLPSSIENMSRLVILNLKNCAMVESLPINISSFSNINGLLGNLWNLETLKALEADRVCELEVPSSILNLCFLKDLNLTNCSLKELSINLGRLSSLEMLHLGRNHFDSIPTSIKGLSKLWYLDLSYCKRLQSLPELPLQLEILNAHSCISLRPPSALSVLYWIGVSKSIGINFSNCFKLVDRTAFKRAVEFAFCRTYSPSLRLFRRSCGYICFPGNEIPEWFIIQSTESSVTFGLKGTPSCHTLCDLILCAIVEFQNYHSEDQSLVICCDYTISITSLDGRVSLLRSNMRGWDFGPGLGNIDSDHVFLGYDFPLNFHECRMGESFMMTVQFYVENLDTKSRDCCCKVTKCGVWGPELMFMTREEINALGD